MRPEEGIPEKMRKIEKKWEARASVKKLVKKRTRSYFSLSFVAVSSPSVACRGKLRQK